jgi:hypothetical protein
MQMENRLLRKASGTVRQVCVCVGGRKIHKATERDKELYIEQKESD